ncbi:hypothetical protein J6590_024775, partial [Homalodisca vitripennis]
TPRTCPYLSIRFTRTMDCKFPALVEMEWINEITQKQTSPKLKIYLVLREFLIECLRYPKWRKTDFFCHKAKFSRKGQKRKWLSEGKVNISYGKEDNEDRRHEKGNTQQRSRFLKRNLDVAVGLEQNDTSSKPVDKNIKKIPAMQV